MLTKPQTKKNKIKSIKSQKKLNHEISKNRNVSAPEDRPASPNTDMESELTRDLQLEDVIFFGGEQDDLDMLNDVDENAELVIGDDEEEAVVLGDIQSILNKMIQSEAVEHNDLKDEMVCNKSSKINEDLAKPDKTKEKSAKKTEKLTTESNPTDIVKTLTAALSSKKNEVASITLPDFHEHGKILLKNCSSWFEVLKDVPKTESQLDASALNKVHEVAIRLWSAEVEIFQRIKSSDKSANASWLRNVLSSGTLTDKVAALTMLTQESPIHQMRALNTLMTMAGKKCKREALIAIDSLRHLFVSDLLPDRKLQTFGQFPVENFKQLSGDGGQMGQDRLLIAMAFEHEIKQVYMEYVKYVEEMSKDQLKNIRSKVLGIIYELLVMRPEQEQRLLAMIVYKLGDPDRKIAAKTQYLLTQLVTRHPNMKMVVIKEVERVLHQPKVTEKAQYYAICFLNQMVLSHQEANIANSLIKIYFNFFKVVSKKEESTEKKLISALLIGVNRAFPYTKGNEHDYDEQVNQLFKLTHSTHLSTSLQALMLLYQVMESRQSVSDRFYQALYGKLLEPELNESSKHTMLLNLVFKSLKADPTVKRIKSFIKRLLQVSSHQQATFTCGVVFLLAEILQTKSACKSLTQQPPDEDEEEKFYDIKVDKEETKKKMDQNVVDDEDVNEVEDADADAPTGGSSWTFVQKIKVGSTVYKPDNRNPLFSGAEFTCAWETAALKRHYHPSVGHFTESFMKGDKINYKGDPLQDFTTMRFLDRFMYRNPKKMEKDHGASIMQPSKQSIRCKEQPVNSKHFLQKPEVKVREDELFFYKYFKMRGSEGANAGSDTKEVDAELYGLENDATEMDFATAMEEKKKLQKTKKKSLKRQVDDDANHSDEAESDNDMMSDGDVDNEENFNDDEDEDEFDYDDLNDDSDFEKDVNELTNKQFSDKDYEKALFQGMAESEEEEELTEDEEEGNGKSGGGGGSGSMFASAEEFAHMLESDKGIHPMQSAYEDRQMGWRGKKMNNKHNEFGKKGHFNKKQVGFKDKGASAKSGKSMKRKRDNANHTSKKSK